MKKIALTGGGTAGHVNPNIALIPALQKRGFDIIYIGSHDGIERNLIEQLDIKYYPIKTGKLRRNISPKNITKNITDMSRAFLGVSEARSILKKEKADIVFSKGGFVGVPVVLGANFLGLPIVIHESDYSVGLANKIAIPFAEKVCVAFPETIKQTGVKKSVLTGNPVRSALFDGKKELGLQICGIDNSKPMLLVMGGSLGSKKINECIRNILSALLTEYNVVHICGKGNVLQELRELHGYCQFDYISEELPHVMAASDMVVSRAGANALAEFIALKKPNLLIPLSKNASRGDQILNAASFQNLGYSAVLEEEQLTEAELLEQIGMLYQNRHKYFKAMSEAPVLDAVSEVMNVITETLDNAKNTSGS